MKPLSGAAREVLGRLQDASGPWIIKALLETLGDLQEPATLPRIQSFLLVEEAPDVARAAAGTVQRLLAAVRVTDLSWLDQRLRDQLPYLWSSPFKSVFHLLHGQIWDTLMAAEHGTAKVACLKLIFHLSKWDSLPYLLAAATSPDAEVTAAARAHVDLWIYRFNRSFTTPAADQVRRIEQEIQKAAGSLDNQTIQRIEFLVKQGW